MDESKAETSENNEESLCKICHDSAAKYCCPRCNILYCSLNCYQSNAHLQCSEYFYKDNVLNEISSNASEESKTKMLEVLHKANPNNELFDDFDDIDENPEHVDSDDDDGYKDISERLAGVNLDDTDQVWDKLTEDEKQEFIAFLKTEDVTKLIPLWQPWWSFYKEVLDEDTLKSESFLKNYPTVCEIKDISEITTKPPSEYVKYNLINIISAYVFMARYFNGEHFDFIREAVSYITSLSLTLKAAENFVDFETAVKSVEQKCINSDWISADEDNFKMMKEDLSRILKGPTKCENKFYLLCALSDIRNLLTQSLKPVQEDKISNFSKKFSDEHLPPAKVETAADIKKFRRKIDYYLSFTKHCYHGYENDVYYSLLEHL